VARGCSTRAAAGALGLISFSTRSRIVRRSAARRSA